MFFSNLKATVTGVKISNFALQAAKMTKKCVNSDTYVKFSSILSGFLKINAVTISPS